MLNKTLQKDVESGLTSPLYFLWSEESCFLEDALSSFVKTVIASGPKDFNYDVFDSSSKPQEIVDAALTLPLMTKRRLVVLKDFHELPVSAIQVLTPYLNEPSGTTCLVILSKKAPKAALKFNGKVYSLNIKEWDIPAWLRNFAAGKGVRLSADAVELLIEFVGYDIGLLIAEIEKLALSGSGTISGKDIISSTSTMRKYTSFDLVDTLIAGQKTRAFRILKTMLSGNAFDAPVILGTLNWHFKQFYSLWRNNGQRPSKMREKTYRTLVKYLPSFKEDDFFRIFRSLHDADIGIKTSGRPGLVLEVLLIRLLQKGAWN
ncbi:MAG TPA: DNA polymerase III subunit delta [Nitrospiraceae bacterium]|nr:DNA polymerase III subunit delta [Nitrospiraceae bacterium]